MLEKFESFGWNVDRVDGHNIEEVLDSIYNARSNSNKPFLIDAQTIKGKGSRIFEGKAKYHGIAPTDEELEVAIQELEAQRKELYSHG